MENRIIENLELFGGRRFTNGGIDRMYFGERILGSKAEASKNFINLKTGEVYSTAKGEEKKEMEEKLMKILRDAEWTGAMISMPSTDRALKNLVNMVKRYNGLLKKATGFSDLRITQDGLVFEGMDAKNEAHRLLLDYMRRFAEANKGIKEKEELQTDNEKFAFRTWLIRLGWKGRETSKLRTSLYEGLSGNSAFCTATSKEKWQAKWMRTEDWDNEWNWTKKQEIPEKWEDWEA